MPLPPGVPRRKRIHTRSTEAEGWKREEGLRDIEARQTDHKNHDYRLASGIRPRGDPFHDMRVRLTINHDCAIGAATASSGAVLCPDGCEKIMPGYVQLVGLGLLRGFRQQNVGH